MPAATTAAALRSATTDEFRLHAATPVVYERAPSAAGDGDGFLVAWVEDERVAGVRLDKSGVSSDAFETPVDEPNHVAVDSLPGGEFVTVASPFVFLLAMVGVPLKLFAPQAARRRGREVGA
jgi:hypothetical protein